MSLWKWNNVELEIDMDDYDFAQKFTKAFDELGGKEKELEKVGSLSDIVKDYCEMFYQLFDAIFGPGTGEKLFNGKRNARICEECYDSFLTECNKQVQESNRRKNAIKNKFKPNRAQRRAAGKK